MEMEMEAEGGRLEKRRRRWATMIMGPEDGTGMGMLGKLGCHCQEPHSGRSTGP